MNNKLKISVDAGKCTGCMSCELVCHFAKKGTFNPKHSRIKVVPLDYLGFSNPVLCLLCENPKCVAACPTGALYQSESGVIQLNEKKCNGCRSCVDECIVGAMNFDEGKNVPLVCDLCDGQPACVRWCPTGALTIRNSVNQRSKKELDYTINKARPLLKKWGVPEAELDWYRKFA